MSRAPLSDLSTILRRLANRSDDVLVKQTLTEWADELPRIDEEIDKAVENLVLAMHIYPNYRLDSRGPTGCIADAIEAIAPEIIAEVRATDWNEVYGRRWAEKE
jgi:hypothetical protein